jgi:hypothetical protein
LTQAQANIIVEKKKDENGQLVQPAVFTPNPAVENLIMPVDLGRADEPIDSFN